MKKVQSGFKPVHSTELHYSDFFYDIPLPTKSGDYLVLVLIDLTAAFHTMDHSIIISHLENLISIRGTSLDWFISHLTERLL